MPLSFGFGKSQFSMKGNAAPGIPTNGLVTFLDASNSASYSGTGSTWSDVGGGGIHATLFSSPTFNSTAPKAFAFSGGKYGRFNTNATWDSLSDSTYSVWVKPVNPGSGEGGLVSHMGGLGEFFLYGSGFYYRNTSTVSSGSNTFNPVNNTLTANTWYMLSSTYDGQTLKIYKNGALLTSQAAVRTAANIIADRPMIFAAAWEPNPGVSGGYGLNGQISSIRIYNRALTLQEISTTFDLTKAYFGL